MAAECHYIRPDLHQCRLQAAFTRLHRRERFCDVTLACEGGRTIRAHRVVLSANSRYFDNVLTNANLDRDTVFIMKDCNYDDVKLIIDFIYNGEINVEQVMQTPK